MSEPLERESVEELVERARTGNREAFDRLAQRYRGRLERQVRSRMGARVRAAASPEDIVQEALLKAYECMARLEWHGEEAFYRWLGSIAEHLIQEEARGAARRYLGLDEDRPDGGTSALGSLVREERLRRLEKAMEDLSPEHREAILLTRIHGLRVAEVAERMGRSPNAVRKLLGRALKELRRRYGETTGSLRLPGSQLEIGGTDDDR